MTDLPQILNGGTLVNHGIVFSEVFKFLFEWVDFYSEISTGKAAFQS